ncbi:uncharacterized protein LOC129579067 isoform X3 [Sitodiplosis mosellana]|uniref:uncharacterized protein LOC129579067 isoform X3 n=2 Tax=Sitodiplosis mosellana TaxID=263140 RepID=UPI002444CF4A|nr:uncharacterized protein LOC129579067 isoform X3 [Sitodiplosis mosellana]
MRGAWMQPELRKNQSKFSVVISIDINNVDWTQKHVLYHLNAVYLKEYGCLTGTIKPKRSSKSWLLLLNRIDLNAFKASKILRSTGPKHTLAVSIQQSQLKHCQSNSRISVSCRCSSDIHTTCAIVLDGGGFGNIDVNVIAVVIVNAMHSSNSPVLTDIDYYDYEKFQYAQSSRHFMNVVNEHCRNVEGRKWFQIWLLYYYNKTKTRLFFKSSDCLYRIVAGTATVAAATEITESSDIQNVLVSSPSLSSLSIQAICNVLKMKLNIACVTAANDNDDIDMLLLYDSMSHLNSSCIMRCNKEILRNKCAPFNNNNNQIKQCARSGQINVDATLLHFVQSQLMNQAQTGSAPYTETKTKTTFAQHMNRQLLPLPPPTTPSSISQIPITTTTTTTTESSMSPLSLSSCDSVATRYSSNQPVINQTKTNNNYNNINKDKHNNKTNNNKNDTRDGDLGKSAGRSNIRERLTRKRFQSETGFAPLTSLSIDLRKMFITFLLPLILLCKMLPMSCAECDQTFVSRPGGSSNGTFAAPVINNVSNHSRQCLYIFLAGPGQRVEIVFTSFNLRGSPPDGAAVGEIPSCGSEYMDIYSEVQSSDPADLINSPFGGRYCGPNLPRRRISLYRAIALSFFTGKNATTTELFTGRYSFINAAIFEIGTPITGSPCSFTITPHKNKSDIFISPTYPGTYPKDLSCTYHFIGESNQRVRLEFRDFDLFFGGPHCPFDFVKVYDGPDNSSELIGTYCGQQRNLVLYSSESSLLVHFFTLRRTASTQNRGFKGIYEFSESFVKLDFIRLNNGMHIRGSECDQKILSKRESTGLVYSPNYPFPYLPKTVCRYFIYGLQDAQHLERVRLEFQMFEIQKGEHKDKDKESNCTDGYLKIFLKGQETQDAYDKFDYELCGHDIPHYVVSDGPRLAMVFSSGELQARGFKAKYTFETEYKIPGTAAPDGSCAFTYKSTSRKKGEFNSPRFPSKYISDTNCTYKFLATPNEQVTIVFDHFKVKADNANVTGGAYGTTACSEDWLEIYVLFRDGNDRFLGRYCGNTAPGPVESPRGATGVRIHLHTDAENVSSGFKGRYVFEVAKSVTGDCGGNYSGQESGIITSPNYPAKYDGPGKGLASRACNWYINSRYGFRVSISIEFFSVEGDPPSRGCPAAALRIWTTPDQQDIAPIELCGDKASSEVWHYISSGQSARLAFITTDKTIGAQGFRIVWTEVQDSIQLSGPPSSIVHHCEPTYLFHCAVSSYCISNKLHCDGIKNCGPGDDSDEMNCESWGGSEKGRIRNPYNIKPGRVLLPNLSRMYNLSSEKKAQASSSPTGLA